MQKYIMYLDKRRKKRLDFERGLILIVYIFFSMRLY